MMESIPEFLDHVAEKYGNRTALYIRRFLRTTKFSYRELESFSVKTAQFLLENHVRQGDMVLIWAPNMPEWVLALLGALSAGIAVVPVGLHSTSEVVEKYIDQTHPKVLFVSKFYPIDLKNPENKGLKVVYLEDLVGLVENILPKKLPAVVSDSLAEIVFTSGTTGEPKGVMISHQNILYEIEQLFKTVPHYKHYRLLSVLPLSHVMEQIVGLFGPLGRGATIYYLPRINTVTIRKALQKYHITDLGVVPQMLRMFLDTTEHQVEQEGDKWLFDLILKITPMLPMFIRRGIFGKIHQSLGNKLYVFGVGSAPLDVKLAQAWEAMGIKVVEGYGASETTGGVTANRINHRKLGSVGKRLPGMELTMSPEKEILVKGDNVTQGYFKNEGKTREAFTSDGYFRTGDVGYFDKNGWLYITGREKFKIVTAAGDKVYPEDVERKLNAHPDVWDSCVLGIKKGDGEIVYATVILKAKPKNKLEDVIKQVNTTLEPNQQILDFSLWPEKDFPRLHTLKVDRNQVKSIIESKNNGKEVKISSATESGDQLINILSEVCKVHPGKIKENSVLVTDLGLDSLKRVELVSLIEEEMNKQVDETLIGSETSVQKLRSLLESASGTDSFPYDLDKISSFLRNPLVKKLKVYLQDLFFQLVGKQIMHVIVLPGFDLKKIKKGPVVFVGNHPGVGDLTCLQQAIPRRLRENLVAPMDEFTWKGWYFSTRKIPIPSFVNILVGGTFPLNKRGGAQKKSLETLIDFLDDGYNSIITPEGQFVESKVGKIGDLRRGVSFLFAGTDMTLIPYYVQGDFEKAFKSIKEEKTVILIGSTDVKVKMGEPFNLKGLSEDQATALIRKKITDLI